MNLLSIPFARLRRMPRRSNANSDESPVTRRTSARIAAAQAASPAKSPAKSPRRKRQSTEPAKTVSDDTESQQSQVKSESSMEELNGIDTSSVKDTELTHDLAEIPHKKTKVDKELDDVNKDELPPSNSLETKQVPAALESCNETVTCGAESVKRTDPNVEPCVNNLNGNFGSQESSKDEPSKPNGTVHVEAHHKTPVPIEEPVIQPLVAPVTGDIVLDAVPEVISQQ
ncbi:unnamed protein product [Schistosoma mattheei]|uniref:Uncharacterized protein n=1 Tax=Schistosoma mattheei TaxID=31246 RepID=A0AA85BS82_9TREM|nr:unnamed protein product [Schistosoma mattheei]